MLHTTNLVAGKSRDHNLINTINNGNIKDYLHFVVVPIPVGSLSYLFGIRAEHIQMSYCFQNKIKNLFTLFVASYFDILSVTRSFRLLCRLYILIQ